MNSSAEGMIWRYLKRFNDNVMNSKTYYKLCVGAMK